MVRKCFSLSLRIYGYNLYLYFVIVLACCKTSLCFELRTDQNNITMVKDKLTQLNFFFLKKLCLMYTNKYNFRNIVIIAYFLLTN